MTYGEFEGDLEKPCQPRKESGEEQFYMPEELRKNIYFLLINYEINRDALQNIPHERFLDLAVVLYVCAKVGGENLYDVMMISESMLSRWNIGFAELYEMAKQNTLEKQPVRIMKLRDLFRDITENFLGKLDENEEDAFFLVDILSDLLVESMNANSCLPKKTMALTNSVYRFGAACILYPGVLKYIAGSRFPKMLILPCSIHEVILVPYTTKAEVDCLKECVAKIGEVDRENKDFLSGSLYIYDAGMDEINIYG